MATNAVLTPQLKALKKTDLSPFIRMSGVMMPRMLESSLKCLNEKQRSAFNKVMPVGGEKKLYIQLVGTPTPPIVIEMAQPPKMNTLPESQVRQQGIKGIRLTADDLQLLTGKRTAGKMLRLGWRLKGQLGALLGIMGMFGPFIWLGPAELKDMQKRMMRHFKPLMELMPKKY